MQERMQDEILHGVMLQKPQQLVQVYVPLQEEELVFAARLR